MYDEATLDLVARVVPVFERQKVVKIDQPKPGHFTCQQPDCNERDMAGTKRYTTALCVHAETDQLFGAILYSQEDEPYRNPTNYMSEVMGARRDQAQSYHEADNFENAEVYVRGWWDLAARGAPFVHSNGIRRLGDIFDVPVAWDEDDDEYPGEVMISYYVPAQRGVYYSAIELHAQWTWTPEQWVERTFVHPGVKYVPPGSKDKWKQRKPKRKVPKPLTHEQVTNDNRQQGDRLTRDDLIAARHRLAEADRERVREQMRQFAANQAAFYAERGDGREI